MGIRLIHRVGGVWGEVKKIVTKWRGRELNHTQIADGLIAFGRVAIFADNKTENPCQVNELEENNLI